MLATLKKLKTNEKLNDHLSLLIAAPVAGVVMGFLVVMLSDAPTTKPMEVFKIKAVDHKSSSYHYPVEAELMKKGYQVEHELEINDSSF